MSSSPGPFMSGPCWPTLALMKFRRPGPGFGVTLSLRDVFSFSALAMARPSAGWDIRCHGAASTPPSVPRTDPEADAACDILLSVLADLLPGRMARFITSAGDLGGGPRHR